MAKIYEFEGLMCSQCEHIHMVHFSGNIFQIYSKNETFDADDFFRPRKQIGLHMPTMQTMDGSRRRKIVFYCFFFLFAILQTLLLIYNKS